MKEKKFVRIFIRPVIQTNGPVGSNRGSICVHLLRFVYVLGFLPLGLGHRRDTGNGVCLHLVLTGMHIFLHARINPCTFKTSIENIKSWGKVFFPSSDKFSKISRFSGTCFSQHCLSSTKIFLGSLRKA